MPQISKGGLPYLPPAIHIETPIDCQAMYTGVGTVEFDKKLERQVVLFRGC